MVIPPAANPVPTPAIVNPRDNPPLTGMNKIPAIPKPAYEGSKSYLLENIEITNEYWFFLNIIGLNPSW